MKVNGFGRGGNKDVAAVSLGLHNISSFFHTSVYSHKSNKVNNLHPDRQLFAGEPPEWPQEHPDYL